MQRHESDGQARKIRSSYRNPERRRAKDTESDYSTLLQSHLHYKAALLKPGVMDAILGILLPALAKEKKERTERDGQIINVVLFLFRNLAFIKDLPPNHQLSADQAELSSLQVRGINYLGIGALMNANAESTYSRIPGRECPRPHPHARIQRQR